MVGSNVALLRPTRHIHTVILLVHRRCSCKYLLICKDEIDGTFWKFTQQLLRVSQMGYAAGLSQVLSMAFLDAFQT